MKATGSPLGKRLRQLREFAGLSPRGLDKVAQLTPGHSYHIETGYRTLLRPETVRRLARTLGVSLEFLLDGKGERPSRDEVVASIGRAKRRNRYAEAAA